MSATPAPASWGKGFKVLLTVILAVAVTGYFVGLRQSRQGVPPGEETPEPVRPTGTDTVPGIVSYAQLPKVDLGPNRHWHPALADLVQPPVADPPKKAAADADLLQALHQRTKTRAFDGAPPVIPHPSSQMGTAVCLACHEKGLYVGDRQAAKMSHPVYASCTQCHVDGSSPETSPDFADNDFQGLVASLHGTRAFPGAPPLIPHAVWMRNDCLSCHGPAGPQALRTTHPERQNCFQCHLPSAALDWPAFFSQEKSSP